MKNELTAWQYFWGVIWWRLSPKKYKNRTFKVYGKKRKVIGETFGFVYLEGMKQGLPKGYIDSISAK